MADQANAVDTTVVADAAPTDSAPVDNTSSEVAGDAFEQALNDDLPSNEGETDSKDKPESENKPKDTAPDDVDETKPDDKPQDETKPLSPKSENRFQQLANDNRELKQQIDQLKAREAQFASEQDLINEINPETGEYYTPQDVERIAFLQSREAQMQSVAQQRYNLEVQQNQQTISSEAQQALKDFPMFDEQSAEYDPQVASQVDKLLGQNLIIDPTSGQIIGSNVSPYQLYQTVHMAQQASSAKGQIDGQKAAEKMLANADVSSSAAPSKKQTDPIIAALMSD